MTALLLSAGCGFPSAPRMGRVMDGAAAGTVLVMAAGRVLVMGYTRTSWPPEANASTLPSPFVSLHAIESVEPAGLVHASEAAAGHRSSSRCGRHNLYASTCCFAGPNLPGRPLRPAGHPRSYRPVRRSSSCRWSPLHRAGGPASRTQAGEPIGTGSAVDQNLGGACRPPDDHVEPPVTVQVAERAVLTGPPTSSCFCTVKLSRPWASKPLLR